MAHLPGIDKHGFCQLKETFGWLQAFQDFSEAFFHLRARNRLALRFASARLASVVCVVSILSLRPCRRHRVAAAVAGDEPTQRKVLVVVVARRIAALAPFEDILNLLVRFETDQPFMLTFPRTDTPIWGFNISRIDDLLQKPVHGHRAHRAVRLVLREVRAAFQEALHFGLRGEMSRRESLQSIADNRRKHVVRDKHLAAT